MTQAELDSIQAALLAQLEEDTVRIISGWYPDDPEYSNERRYGGMDRWNSMKQKMMR